MAVRFSLNLLLFITIAIAQTPDTATLQGQVTDRTGGVVLAAQVVIRNVDTGARRETRTDAAGRYAVAGLPLTGTYQLSVDKPGFGTALPPPLRLRANEAATVDVTLEPEGLHGQVNVLGTADGARHDSPQLETRLDLATIEHTPVLGRKITTLPLLDSAVRPARGTGDLFLNNTLFVVNGAGRRQTPFVVDGSTGDDAWGRQSIFTNLPFAAIEEFTVAANSFSAEFGRSAGGVGLRGR